MTEPRTHLNDAHYVLKIEAKINSKFISCAVQECCWPREQTKICYLKLCLTHEVIRAKKTRGNGGKQRKTGYRPLGKLFLFVFVVFFPVGQACFLALIVWHWQQAACSDTHRSNESPTSEVFTTHQWMRIDYENCLRITLQKSPVHHQRTSIKFDII